MRHPVSFTLVCLVSLSTGVFFLACGADDKGDPPSSGRGGGAGIDLDTLFKNNDSGGLDGSGGQDGGLADASDSGPSKPDAGPPSCESCGSAESVKSCGSALTACKANTGCKRIYDCIYTYRGCGLTSSDIDCIQGCFDDYCDDEKSIELYLAYDQCTYCSPVCARSCSSYCSGFPEGGIPTRCGGGGVVPDAGDDAPAFLDGSDEADGAGGADGSSDGAGGSGGEEADAAPDVEGPEQVCAPGKQEPCACVGGTQGAQVCNSKGSGFGPCYCPRRDAGSSRPDSGMGGGWEEDEDD